MLNMREKGYLSKFVYNCLLPKDPSSIKKPSFSREKSMTQDFLSLRSQGRFKF